MKKCRRRGRRRQGGNALSARPGSEGRDRFRESRALPKALRKTEPMGFPRWSVRTGQVFLEHRARVLGGLTAFAIPV